MINCHFVCLTLKNSLVDPDSTVPYLISVCLARSSADSMGEFMRSTVRKAARLAVYDDMMMRVKNHHTLPTIRPDIDLWSTERTMLCYCNNQHDREQEKETTSLPFNESKNLAPDPTTEPPEFDLARRHCTTINHIRTLHRQWGLQM